MDEVEVMVGALWVGEAMGGKMGMSGLWSSDRDGEGLSSATKLVIPMGLFLDPERLLPKFVKKGHLCFL